MVNLIATIPGARKERIALAGHYDTKLFREFRFVGANDGGSSAAFLLEMARVLKARRNAFTVELMFFDGEEATLRDWGGTDHTYGSQYYVDSAQEGRHARRPEGDGAGGHDRRPLPPHHARNGVDQVAHRRNLGRPRSAWATARCSWMRPRAIEDDHMPFLEAGVQAADIIDLDYPAWHTAGDTLDQTSARSLEIVGKVVQSAWPALEARLK